MNRKISRRVRGIESSATLKMADLAKELRREGEDVISLGVGEPDFDTPSNIKECSKKALDEGFVHYTESKGIPELRELLSEKLERDNGVDKTPEEIILTPGAKFAIYLACQTLLDDGDKALLFDPSWVSYKESVKMAGAEVEWCPVGDDLVPSIEDYKEKLESMDISLVVINSPCNPTGQVYSEDEVKELVEVAVDNNATVLSDEIYEKIIYDREHYSPASDYDDVVTINGFSKTYSMTGWRLGYIVGERDLIDQIIKIQQHSVSCPTSFAQKGALCALEDPESDEVVSEMVRRFRDRRDLLVEGLNSFSDVECVKPEGAFYAFPDVGRNSDEVAEKLLRECHVVVTPGSAFGEDCKNNIRISYARSEERIREALNRMEKVFD
ncbi:pyridoxal phosphate-dependent aminotransferase [Methanonatronarchaeum sp. AMET6-2]|uniref:pyridoxal phosphate-dependent aminotransferase n=1 Tax=Methanonatronarchaeum sp. AMET6-2 TaxID=2933293 RepID=UPI0012032A04|nr:pyridoxal phosphate-dependent aminotransferase [Methanonatronarchaeum sp. AMET6-2]RZN63370.1 MAG: pyridoxal phosphate-dependent aminotransferase [Methanonatronarchaeia archaeon]UOY10568.1 pyridoxal phosphate-dependent aminotransferase [Methanonatronarchaeum sp. AMET6-2]